MKSKKKNAEMGERVYTVRGKKVILDFDAAELYEVRANTLKRAVLRNKNRFPNDSLLELTEKEWESLKYEFDFSHRSEIKTPPQAFTHHGFATLSTILNSKAAIDLNIQIIRTLHKAGKLNLEDLLFTLENIGSMSVPTLQSAPITRSINLN